jgi:hypothetical protein
LARSAGEGAGSASERAFAAAARNVSAAFPGTTPLPVHASCALRSRPRTTPCPAGTPAPFHRRREPYARMLRSP